MSTTRSCSKIEGNITKSALSLSQNTRGWSPFKEAYRGKPTRGVKKKGGRKVEEERRGP